MDFYAYYLPQFHEIKENDEWWGKGFTEWTNVKKAGKLFCGHKQPQIPLNNNYYNLLDKKTLLWQLDLANTYGIKGFIFYHYYFEGKKLLEKPAELLLANSDIPMNFFFCWANHSWNRAWKNSKEVLMAQTYGGKKEWEEHFQYLLQFFSDDRYLKIQNKPALMIFNIDFCEKNEMMEYFDARCKEEGFSGLYLIESYKGVESIEQLNDKLSTVTQAVAKREPDYCLSTMSKRRGLFSRGILKLKRIMVDHGVKSCVRVFKGKKIYKILKSDVNLGCKVDVINGVYFSWDNTPRHSARGFVITQIDKDNFFEYMDMLQKKSDSNLVFVNAWNEWAEGMILEPTEDNGYKYLEWIKEWKNSREVKE